MDPNLFRLDWARTTEVLGGIVVLAFFLERALAVLFEHRAFIDRFEAKGYKELIAFGVAAWVCVALNFDAISMVILQPTTTTWGAILTGAVVAGGSKASVKLFHDVLDVRSSRHEAEFPKNPTTKKPEPVGQTETARALESRVQP